MSKLIMTMGLPGSGKSSAANNVIYRSDPPCKGVSKDALRVMLDQNVWSPDNEKMILRIRDAIITDCMTYDIDVIVHDTNLNPKMRRQFEQMINIHNKRGSNQVELVVWDDFLQTPVDVCIERDSQRTGFDYVGSDVIERMARDFERWYGYKLPGAK